MSIFSKETGEEILEIRRKRAELKQHISAVNADKEKDMLPNGVQVTNTNSPRHSGTTESAKPELLMGEIRRAFATLEYAIDHYPRSGALYSARREMNRLLSLLEYPVSTPPQEPPTIRYRRSHWNYRIVRRMVPSGLNPDQTMEWFAIHEAHYDENGVCYGISENPCTLEGESVMEIKGDRTLMLEAFKRLVLDYETRQDIKESR